VKRNAADEKELLSIEDNILISLSQGSGGVAELLLDESLINQLQNSKKFAE
jgi:dynein heavy chain